MTAAKKIEPVRKTLELNCDARTAFDFYTQRLGEWWPFATHSIGGAKTVAVAMECREGGCLYETHDDGAEMVWGRILRWEPGALLVHSWHLQRSPEQATEVEIRFTDLGPGRCRVELEHRNWDILGEDGARLRGNYDGGWDRVLGAEFGGFVRRKTAA